MTKIINIKTKESPKSEKSLEKLVAKKTEEAKKEKKKKTEFFISQINQQMFPKIGEQIDGKIIEISKNAIRFDLGMYGLGVVRGRELWETMDLNTDLKVGDICTMTILELENEEGEMELTFRKATREQIWAELSQKQEKGEKISVKIQGANKGGLLTAICGIPAFMPVSQLIPEHYPKVEGGDQNKILSKLQKFIGKKMVVKLIAADPKEKKLIISEKKAILDEQKRKLNKIKIGDVVSGKITAVVDFGAFVKFNLPKEKEKFEGLIHISELSWKRVTDPQKIVKVGDQVQAEIIGVDDTKITLSIKKLQKDPWVDAAKKYKVGQTVVGTITKIEPFGAFAQLDRDIHGLVHISEFSSKKVKSTDFLKVGEKRKFKILSIEPEEHRLGLSLRAIAEEKEKNKKQ